MKPILSVCFGTLQREKYLRRAVESARRACGEFSHEFVIADGGSDDGTLEYLREQKDVTLIEIGERTGAVVAFNQAFAAARGEFVAAFNDDAACIGTPFADAVKMLRADPRIGQIAIPYAGDERETPHTELVNTERYGKVCFANFGVIRREMGDMLGWWGSSDANGKQQYYQYGGDTELSVKVWYVGYRVVPLRTYRPNMRLTDADSRIIHYLADDDTRVPNVEAALFRAKWQKGNGATPPTPVDDAPTVSIRYLGKRHGSVPYQRGGSPHKYSVSAAQPVFTVQREDAAWFLGLRERGRKVFERMAQ